MPVARVQPDMIYLDNAATSWPKPRPVVDAVLDSLQRGGNPGRGGYDAALDAGRTLYEARRLAAELFGASNPRQVVLSHNATGALNLAIHGLLQPGQHVVSTDLEHNSVLRPLYTVRAKGVQLTLVRSQRGVVTTDQIAAALQPNTSLVVLTHGSNVLGTVQPIEEVGALCADRGIVLCVDAAQTAGLLPLSMAGHGIGAIACSGHKSLLGPQGTGLLVVRPDVHPSPLEQGGTGVDSFSEQMPVSLPEGLEAGTGNGPGVAGLGAGLRAVLDAGAAVRPSDHWQLAMARARQLRDGLLELDCFEFPEVDQAAWRLPVVSGNVRTRAGTLLDSQLVADALWQRAGTAVRGGFHCAPLVHTHYGTKYTGMVRGTRYTGMVRGTRDTGMVRFSPGHQTTSVEISAALDAVAAIAEAG